MCQSQHTYERWTDRWRQVEGAELAVALDQEVPLPVGLEISPRHEHPDVLDRRTDDHVVEVEKEPTLSTVEQIARMAVPMDRLELDPAAAIAIDLDQRLDGGRVSVVTAGG